MEVSLDYKETLAVGVGPYQELAYAVIADACIEYSEILKKIPKASTVVRTWLLRDRDKLRTFFMSSWFMELAGPFGDEISGERILQLLDPECTDEWFEARRQHDEIKKATQEREEILLHECKIQKREEKRSSLPTKRGRQKKKG